MKKRTILLLILAIAYLVTANLAQPSYALSLQIVVATSKQVYNVGEIVNISGNLTYNGQPVADGLVALQVNDRLGGYTIFRTLNTGTNPTGPWDIEVTGAYLGDIYGNPVTNAKRGSDYWIHMVYTNNQNYWIRALFAFTIYNVNNAPMFTSAMTFTDVPPGTWSAGKQWRVPSDAALGAAKVYGVAFTNFTENEGYAFCPEKSSTFNVVSATGSLSIVNKINPEAEVQSAGTYGTSFMLPKQGSRLGNYIVYVSSFYQGFKDQGTTSFEVILLGDANGDKIVNAKDAVLVGAAFGSQPGDSNWNPDADLFADGIINAKDAVIVGTNFLNSGT